jgi:hypothetical protein
MPTVTHDAIVEALKSVISTALATVEGAPALEYDEPRLADPDPQGENRFRVVLMSTGRAPANDQLATPPPFFVEASFALGLHGVGSDDAARRSLMSDMARAIDAAITADWSLGGVASFAQVTALESDTDKQSGFAPENLLDIAIEVEFDSLTRLG